MRKKAGILTFHEADNYGATLQAYALMKKVSEYIETEIINYHCEYILNQVKMIDNLPFPKRSIAVIFKAKKHAAFSSFNKRYLMLSKDYTRYNIEQANDNFDVIFVGSDQVWNTECTNSDMTFFLDFLKDTSKIKSYAVSFGSGLYPVEYERLIKRFNTVSLREVKYKEKLDGLCENVRIDVDPTLLLMNEEWERFLHGSLCRNKYIFVYLVGEQVELLKRASEYAKRNECKLITNKKSVEFFFHCSPIDFINWIYYADCIFTNSFHGTVFSLLFHKKFTVECTIKGGFNNRASGLLERLGLSEVMLEKWDETAIKDWTNADVILNEMRKDSLKYISSTISAV